MNKSFKIENRNIEYNFDELQSNEISIDSMPYKYTVSFIDDEVLKIELDKLKDYNNDKHFVFIDNTVFNLYGDSIFQGHETHKLKAKESNKALPAVTRLIDKLENKNFSKKEIFVSAGGGITQDISSFVRAVFKRGISWTYIPTTLLAMGDSCIGAKACLNYGEVKNQLGLFSAPQKVLINSNFLKTLPERDVLSGYGEIIKLCIIGGEASIEKFESLAGSNDGNRLNKISDLVKLSLNIKKSVIEVDEFEKNIRRALNYGHTIGHAIEPLVNYKIPHGIAVSIGIVIENLVAAEFGSLSKEEAYNLNNIILRFIDKKSLELLKEISIDDVIGNMKKDKKAMGNDIYISVPKNIGHFDMLKIASNDTLKRLMKETIRNIAY